MLQRWTMANQFGAVRDTASGEHFLNMKGAGPITPEIKLDGRLGWLLKVAGDDAYLLAMMAVALHNDMERPFKLVLEIQHE